MYDHLFEPRFTGVTGADSLNLPDAPIDFRSGDKPVIKRSVNTVRRPRTTDGIEYSVATRQMTPSETARREVWQDNMLAGMLARQARIMESNGS